MMQAKTQQRAVDLATLHGFVAYATTRGDVKVEFPNGAEGYTDIVRCRTMAEVRKALGYKE